MKKIILGKTLEETTKGVCDFCGEKNTDGIAGDKICKTFDYQEQPKLELEWLKKHWFEYTKLFWVKVKDGEYKTEEYCFWPVICKNCIRQLAKQI